MVHKDVWRNGVKLVSATEIPAIIGKYFLDLWRIKLCQCKTHKGTNKSPFKKSELIVLDKFGPHHCGYVYAEQVKDNAGDLGNDVHELVECWFNAIPHRDTIGPEAIEWATKIVTLYKQHNVTPKLIIPEGKMIDEASGLIGSADTIGEWDGRLEILDTKIKNNLDELTGMQGMAYRYLIRRIYGVDIRFMRVIWCRKEHKDRDVKDVLIDLDEWVEPWKALITVWNKLNKKRQVKIIE